MKKACLLWSLPFLDNYFSSAFFSSVNVLICSLNNFSSFLVDLDSDRLLLGDLPPSASEIRIKQMGLFNGEGGGGGGSRVALKRSHVNFKTYQRV